MRTAPLSKRYQVVDGKRTAFRECGDGDAIVFLHGNPTSSHTWRNVVPRVAHEGSCLVPDLGFERARRHRNRVAGIAYMEMRELARRSE